MRIINLKPWKAETFRDLDAMKALSKDGMETHKLNDLLVPPALRKHMQCGDCSDIGNTGEQVRPCSCSRFNKLAQCTSAHPVPLEYIATAKLRSDAVEAYMTKQATVADETRTATATEHPKFGMHIPIIHHTSPSVFVARGLGDTGTQRSKLATTDRNKQVIEVTFTTGSQGSRKIVHGSTGRTPKIITHDSTLVHNGAIKTDALFIACLEIGKYPNKHTAIVVLQGIPGCGEDQASVKLANLCYADPPKEYGAMLIPSYAHDHSQTTLMVTARRLTNIGVVVLGVPGNSAGSSPATLLASLTNHWAENIQDSPRTNTFRIQDWIATAPTFAPEHLDEVVNLVGTRITIIACSHNMLALAGDPTPAMQKNIDDMNSQASSAARYGDPMLWPPKPTVNSIRFGGSVPELRRVFEQKMHWASTTSSVHRNLTRTSLPKKPVNKVTTSVCMWKLYDSTPPSQISYRQQPHS